MTGTEIVRRGASLPDKIAYAKALADSGLLPAAYRKQPANVLYATEYGEMLGLAPLAAINGLHVIEGKPTASAGMVSSLVRRAGHRLRSGYDKATGIGWCEIVRHDDPEFTYRAEWTIERAIDAGLVERKNGRLWSRDSKGRPKPWERYPEAMLKARAITECARDACEEALNGVHYTPEELGADVDEAGEPIRVTAERADQPAPTPAEPDPAEQPAAEPIDWDALLAQAAGDYDALRELWTRAFHAEPDNAALLHRIGEAGKAAAAAAEQQPIDAELVDEHEPTEPTAAAEQDPESAQPEQPPATVAASRADPPTPKQLTKLHTLLRGLAVLGDENKHETVSLLIGRPIESTKQLTQPEISGVIELLERCLADPQPVPALDTVLAELANAQLPTPDTKES